MSLINHANIILIGFMGSGKSSIGKRLAKHLHCDYIDTDQLIIEQTNKSIADLVQEEGEQAFRAIESAVLENLLGRKNFVLATGGGTILDPKNQETLRQLGTIVWLHASADTLFERARRNTSRFLLEVEHPRHTFNHLLTKRLALYEMLSQVKIDTTHLSYQQTLDTIIQALKEETSV